jgi:hypothetical protein
MGTYGQRFKRVLDSYEMEMDNFVEERGSLEMAKLSVEKR